MILGIGTDLVDIRRIERTIARHGDRFLDRIFTSTERRIAERRANPAATYAKRFAAKEACAKFSRRFREMERLAFEQGTALADVPRAQMESFWEQSKRNELPAPARKLAR